MDSKETIKMKMVDYIDRHSDEIVDFLSELVRIRSIFPSGEYEMISERMKKEFEIIGLDVKLISAPKDKVESVGLKYPRPNVSAFIEGTEKKPVLMIGTHMDVVEVEDPGKWKFDPFGGVVNEGKVWGRGTCDAKCAMTAQVFAAKAIVDAGIKLEGSLMLVSSVDDEGRFDHLRWPGITFLVEEGFKEAGYPLPDMVINGEASGLENICGSFKGRIMLEINVCGETAHAGTPYGVNAIDKALKLIDALDRIELMDNPLQGQETMNICAIEAVAERYGDIPPTCKVGYEIRIVAPYSTRRVRDQIDRTMESLKEADQNFRIGDITIFSERQPIEINENELVVTAIKEAARFVGISANFAAILGTGELQPFLTRGIPGVTYGPGSIGRVHKNDEYVEIDELVNQTKIYALTALNACGYHV